MCLLLELTCDWKAGSRLEHHTCMWTGNNQTLEIKTLHTGVSKPVEHISSIALDIELGPILCQGLPGSCTNYLIAD